MEIVIAAGSMPFGPETLTHKSLGGSETAVLMLAKKLKAKGHLVTVFCNLPAEGEPDFIHPGENGDDGVRYVPIQNYQKYIVNTQCDLLIASRDPRLVALPAAAKKKVLWCHDLATHRGMQVAFDQINWTVDEMWAVSKFHADQIHKVTGYPRKFIKVVTNGIVPVDIIPAPRSENQLVYASRPERGLENLIKEGGVMEHLPEFELKVAMYDHFPEDMKEFYQWVFARIKELPNVEVVGALPQQKMRQLLADSTAYIYPTQFEETSCILARECCEVGTPFLTTVEGALPETLGDCGVFFRHTDKLEKGSLDWCKEFARWFKVALTDDDEIDKVRGRMSRRTDLYWDTACKQVLRYSKPKPVKTFSRAWSLVQDGDVIPAYALLSEEDKLDLPCLKLTREIEEFYPFILPKECPEYETLASYYRRFYEFKKSDISYGIDYGRNTQRFNMIKEAVAKGTKPGDTIVEYGCGEGHISGPLAKDFPDRRFFAFDQVQQNVDMVNQFEQDFGTTNLKAYRVDTPHDARFELLDRGVVAADLVICVEVLEHCVRPWEVATDVELMCKKDGRLVITTPYGAWEPQTFSKIKEEFLWRNHIWHLDKDAVRKMFGKKPGMEMMSLTNGNDDTDFRPIGNLFYTYTADHKPIKPLDPLAKAKSAHARQTVAIAAICMNDEDTILHMLHSIDRKVQFVQFAMGPSTDRTRELIEKFFADHPHMQYRIKEVPKIEPSFKQEDGTWTRGYGFDHARNASTEGLDAFDWILWMDTDEYMSGMIGRYLRGNALDAYLVPQHHFTTQPRGSQTQIDRPARLFRTGKGFKAIGHIHEHFETAKGGPGMTFMLTDVDLGHTGYVNEDVRRDRFNRNFPFLLWDHDENPDRRLGKYLWFRDIIHRMRWCEQEKNMNGAITLANDAEKYYNDNWRDMATFGTGTFQAIQYLAEARKLLKKGTPVKFGLMLDDRNCEIEGLFLNTDEITRVVKQILDPEFKRRGSEYY